MVDIKQELDSNQTVLLLMSSVEYNDVLIETLKSLSGNVCYITTNKTFDSLKEIFVKNKVDIENVVFIDAISKTIKKTPDQAENVYYVSSPGALTELSLVIERFLNHGFDYLVFDSYTNLEIYNKPDVCAKFVSSLVNNVKKGKTKAVFYAIGAKEDEKVTQVSGFVDKVIQTEVK